MLGLGVLPGGGLEYPWPWLTLPGIPLGSGGGGGTAGGSGACSERGAIPETWREGADAGPPTCGAMGGTGDEGRCGGSGARGGGLFGWGMRSLGSGTRLGDAEGEYPWVGKNWRGSCRDRA